MVLFQQPHPSERLPLSHQALIEDLINRMVSPGVPSLDPLKLTILIIWVALSVYQTLGDMLSIIVSNCLRFAHPAEAIGGQDWLLVDWPRSVITL